MMCSHAKISRQCPPLDGAASGRRNPAGIGVGLCSNKGEVLVSFSKLVGVKDSNVAEVMAILEASRIFMLFLHEAFIMDSGSFNAISWISSLAKVLRSSTTFLRRQVTFYLRMSFNMLMI